MNNVFPSRFRLRKSWEFKSVRKMGCKSTTPHFILVKAVSDTPISRLGITASKKTGNAVKRNRSKRLIRQYFRTHRDVIDVYDYSVIVKKSISHLSSVTIFSELDRLFLKK